MENVSESKSVLNVVQYIKFLGGQFKDWHPTSYILFGFAMGLQLLTLVTNPITILSIVTMISVLLGVLCILSISQAKSVNGWLGLISAVGFIYVAFSAKNYLQIAEQIVYMVTLDIPVIVNLDWNKNMAGKIKHLNAKSASIAIISLLILWSISAFSIEHLTNDPRPIIDALVFSVATISGMLAYFKYSEQYIGWSVTGIVSLVLWFITFQQGDATIAMLLSSLVYVINDLIGFCFSPWWNKSSLEKLALQEQNAKLN